jgi:hypothetical protein
MKRHHKTVLIVFVLITFGLTPKVRSQEMVFEKMEAISTQNLEKALQQEPKLAMNGDCIKKEICLTEKSLAEESRSIKRAERSF